MSSRCRRAAARHRSLHRGEGWPRGGGGARGAPQTAQRRSPVMTFFAKLGRVRTYGRRGLPGVRSPRVGPPGRPQTYPSSSCTTGRAPRCCRCRRVRRLRRAARRDRRSGRPRREADADSPGTSCHAGHAKREALAHSGAARPACCRGRCAGCGWTGGRAACSGYPRGWWRHHRPHTASRLAPPSPGGGSDAGDAPIHAHRHRVERERRG